jgi:hypothetical protein
VSLDDKATPFSATHVKPGLPEERDTASALDILLDGVEKRVASRP